MLAAATLAAFGWALTSSDEVRRATTIAFLTLGLGQLFHVFNSRFEHGSAISRRLFTNWTVWAAVGFTILLELVAVYLPAARLVLDLVVPSAAEWVVIVVAAIAPALVVEAFKVVRQLAAGRASP